MSLLHKLHNVAHAVGEYVTPVLQKSAFQERGVLTPEEFIQAGDQLVRMCPTWEWAGGDPTKRRPYLPDNKQFLITRGVTCEHRVRALEEEYSAEVEVEGVDANDDGDTWLATHNNKATSHGTMDQQVEAFDMSSVEKAAEAVASSGVSTPAPAPAPPAPGKEENEDGFIDLDEFAEADLEDTTGTSATSGAAKGSDDVVKMRTYDLSITYDKYYQTPRVWLYGYDEQHQPLTGDQVMEDIMQDYANKTVTIEPHPHLSGGVVYASIHPCRHAEVMKKIISHLSDGGKVAEPRQYLFMFLKFIQSVIPTINYDNTIEVQAM